MCPPHSTLPSHLKEIPNTHMHELCAFHLKVLTSDKTAFLALKDCLKLRKSSKIKVFPVRVRKKKSYMRKLQWSKTQRWDALNGFSGLDAFTVTFTFILSSFERLNLFVASDSEFISVELNLSASDRHCAAFSASHSLSGQSSQELTQNHKLIALSEPFV